MGRYLAVIGLVMTLFLGLFLVVGVLELPLLSDPSPWLERGGLAAAGVGLGLLVADVILPVPSSLVMIAFGALYGAVFGGALALLGGLLAAGVGFWLGRRGGPLLDRVVDADERRRAERFVAEWGSLAVLVSRPVPLLAETVAVMAGTSAMTWPRFLAAAALGSVAPAALFALTGATARSFDGSAWVFLAVLGVAGVVYAVGLLARRRA